MFGFLINLLDLIISSSGLRMFNQYSFSVDINVIICGLNVMALVESEVS